MACHVIEAFGCRLQTCTRTVKKLLPTKADIFKKQNPKLEGFLENFVETELCLGGFCSGRLPGPPVLNVLSLQEVVGINEPLNLTVQAESQQSSVVIKVWADVVPPHAIYDNNGYPILPPCQVIDFGNIDHYQWQPKQSFSSKCGNLNGKYTLFLNAENSTGNKTEPSERPRKKFFVGMPPLGSGVDFFGNSNSNSQFFGGISVNRGNYERSQVLQSVSDEGHVLGAIEVDPAHVNQRADIFAYAQFSGPGSEGYYMLGKKDPNGNNAPVLSWDGNLTTLATHDRKPTLEQTQEVSIYQGLFPVGTYKIYFGYRLPENGMLVRNSQPIEVKVN